MSLNTGPRAGAVTDNFTKAPAAASAHETNSLSRPVSGQLLKAVADGVAIKRAVGGYSSITRNIVLALMSVPVWLMIVLLSPLDAWAATREIARQM
ncbi:MAG: hypothetical protein ACREEM_38550 [Blastocatellia bacterium]